MRTPKWILKEENGEVYKIYNNIVWLEKVHFKILMKKMGNF